MLRHRGAWMAFSVLLSSSAVARGQTDDAQTDAVARTLYEKAEADMTAGDFLHACSRLEEVKRFAPKQVAVATELARCYAEMGRAASAWAEYSRARSLAERQQNSASVELINARLAELLPQIPQMWVVVPAEVASLPGLRIRRNGVVVGPGQWGLAVPVDPGTYEIEVTAPGRKAQAMKVKVLPKTAPSDPPVLVTILPLVPEPRPRLRVAASLVSMVGLGYLVPYREASVVDSKDPALTYGDAYVRGQSQSFGGQLRVVMGREGSALVWGGLGEYRRVVQGARCEPIPPAQAEVVEGLRIVSCSHLLETDRVLLGGMLGLRLVRGSWVGLTALSHLATGADLPSRREMSAEYVDHAGRRRTYTEVQPTGLSFVLKGGLEAVLTLHPSFFASRFSLTASVGIGASAREGGCIAAVCLSADMGLGAELAL